MSETRDDLSETSDDLSDTQDDLGQLQDSLSHCEEEFPQGWISRERKIQLVMRNIKDSLEGMTNRMSNDIRARDSSVSSHSHVLFRLSPLISEKADRNIHDLHRNKEENFNDWILKLRCQMNKSDMYSALVVRSSQRRLLACLSATDLCAKALGFITKIMQWRAWVNSLNFPNKKDIDDIFDCEKEIYKPARAELGLHLCAAHWTLQRVLEYHKSLEAQVPQDILCGFREDDEIKRKELLEACWDAAFEEQKVDIEGSNFSAQIKVIIILLQLTVNPEIEIYVKSLEKVAEDVDVYREELGDYEELEDVE